MPLFASEAFEGKSPRGLYGDVVEEIDWGVGRILDTLRSEGLAQDTLVLFTSDNGPWLVFDDHGGSAGLLREGKGTTWEGGMREPCIVWWPGRIAAGSVSHGMASTMDVLPTFTKLAGASVQLPEGRVLDGVDMSPILFGEGPSRRSTMFYYRGEQLYAVRSGAFKAHLITQPAYVPGKAERHDPPLLYNLEHDPSEKYEVGSRHPEVLAAIREEIQRHETGLRRGEVQLDERIKR